MKIYTKTGDAGQTGLFGGGRLPKDDPRIEAYGTVDELNAVLGLARAESLPPEIDRSLARIQNELFNLGAELATPDAQRQATRYVSAADIERLEREIDDHESRLAPLRQFILPGGTKAAAVLHVARGVCRRAERRLVTLGRQQPVSETMLAYVNRLGDWLFVVARAVNASAGQPDVPWQSGPGE